MYMQLWIMINIWAELKKNEISQQNVKVRTYENNSDDFYNKWL